MTLEYARELIFRELERIGINPDYVADGEIDRAAQIIIDAQLKPRKMGRKPKRA